MYKVNIKEGNKNRTIEREKLLTIGIITKNEPERLERCLKSLIPIREAIDSEIIVTDTGSTDNTVEVAEKYADKVLHFEWCDDFAAARNTGIDEAKGLWFMWIDSDEWIEKPESLIEFFRSEEYKYFTAANVSLVNIYDFKKNIKSKLKVNRMVLLLENQYFIGKIHEFLRFSNPTFEISSFVFHDGYAFNDIQEKNEKHLRNMDLLLIEYDKNPFSIDIIKYITNQYRFNGEFEIANEYCDKGIIILENDLEKYHLNKANWLNFIILKASNYYEMKQYSECIRILDNIIDDDNMLSNRFIDIYAIRFAAYMKLEDNYKCSQCSEKFLDYYFQKPNFDRTYETIIFSIYDRKDVARIAIENCLDNLQKKDFRHIMDINECKYLKYIKSLRDVDLQFDKSNNIKYYVLYLFKLMVKIDYFALIRSEYTEIISGDDKDIISLFEKNVISYISSDNKYENIILSELSKVRYDSELVRFSKIKLMYDDSEEKKLALSKTYSRNIANIDIRLKSEYLYMAITNLLNFKVFNKHMDIFFSNMYIKSLISKKQNYLENVISYYYSYKDNNYEVDFLYFIVSMIEGLRMENENEAILYRIYHIYIEILPQIIKSVYNTEMIDKNSIYIYPPIIRFGYFIEKAQSLKKSGDYLSYIIELKNCLEHFPQIANVIKREIRDIEIEIEKEGEKTNELNEIAKGVKKKVYELITQGKRTEALNIAQQLNAIIPNDMETIQICSRLRDI